MTPRTIDARYHAEGIASNCYLAPGVTVRGDVQIGDRSSVWFGAVIRGDTEQVRIGRETNIQDLVVLHSDPGYPCRIGDRVTIGHGAIVHGAEVGDGSMIGIRAVVLNGAKVGAGSLIGAGAVVTEGTEIPPGSVVMGIPAKVVRETNQLDRQRLVRAAEHYVEAAAVYSQAESQEQSPSGRDQP